LTGISNPILHIFRNGEFTPVNFIFYKVSQQKSRGVKSGDLGGKGILLLLLIQQLENTFMFLKLDDHYGREHYHMLEPHPYSGGKWNVFQKDLQFVNQKIIVACSC